MSLERLWYPPKPESLFARLLHLPLALAAGVFGLGVSLRNALFDAGVRRAHRIAGVQVISIGNLTVGGAGKTPAAIFLAQRLVAAGRRVAVLSRGHGRASTRAFSFDATTLPSASEAGDEPILIATRVPGVRVYVGADRVASARAAKADGAQVLLLDDGMQHRRLARDLDIVVIDEAAGFGNGRLLPRGPLREPPSALRRASLIWLREGAPAALLPSFTQPRVRTRYAPSHLIAPDGTVHPPTHLAERRVVALCGLARPGSFTRTLQSTGAKVVAGVARPDHHPWTPAELADAQRLAEREGALLVTTEKDAVKLPAAERPWVLRLEVELVDGEEVLDRLLAAPAES